MFVSRFFSYCLPYGQSHEAHIYVERLLKNFEKPEIAIKICHAIRQLTSNEIFQKVSAEKEEEALNFNIASYYIRQFANYCQAFNLELNLIKEQSRGASAFQYLEAFDQQVKTMQTFINKVALNGPFLQAFTSFMRSEHGLFLDESEEAEYHAPYLMTHILDQIWLESVYVPQQVNIFDCFSGEYANSMQIEKLENFANGKYQILNEVVGHVSSIEQMEK